jgi:hypothetical protein
VCVRAAHSAAYASAVKSSQGLSCRQCIDEVRFFVEGQHHQHNDCKDGRAICGVISHHTCISIIDKWPVVVCARCILLHMQLPVVCPAVNVFELKHNFFNTMSAKTDRPCVVLSHTKHKHYRQVASSCVRAVHTA